MTPALLDRPPAADPTEPPGPTDDGTRRDLLAAGLALALGAAGCGDDDAAGGPATRRVRHALGVAQVPLRPQRVLPLDANELEQVVALGLDPVGTIPDRLPHLPKSAYDVRSALTAAYEVKLETVAELAPDVILGPTFYITEDNHPALSRIAPTLAIDRAGFRRWREELRFVARALGASEQAEAQLARYARRVRDVRAAIGPQALAKSTVTTFLGGDENVRLYVRGFPNTVLDDVGVRPPGQDRLVPAGDEEVELSLERLAELEADVLIRCEIPTGRSSLDDNALYRRLAAVRAGRVLEADAFTWNQGSVLAALTILDDLERGLSKLV